MSYVAHTCGFLTSGTINGGKVDSDFTITDISFGSTPADAYALAKDWDGEFYVYTTTGVAKYDETYAAITTWGVGGVATVNSAILSITGRPIKVGDNRQIVASTLGISVNLHAFTSAGVTLWSKAVATGHGCSAVAFLPSGNIIAGVGTGAGTTLNVFREYNGTTGAVAYTYSGISMRTNEWTTGQAMCVTSAGELIYGGSGTTGSKIAKYTVGASTPVWTVSLGSTALQSFSGPGGFLYTLGSTNASAVVYKTNVATGVITASAPGVAATPRFYRGALVEDSTLVALASVATNWTNFSAALSVVANTQVTPLAPLDVVGENPYSFAVQAPLDVTYSKRLVAIANDQVWWESSYGTMAELTACQAIISTGSPVMAVDGYQKMFIANGSTKQVVDFANTKIWTGTLGTNVPPNGTILTGGTSSAQMVLDYLTNSSSSCELYGFQTTILGFVSAETVTNAALSVSFTLGAAGVSAPHTYSWTSYGRDTATYGALPGRATLCCRYRGRLVLSGNSNYPHQWYMSRTANPWDWQYQSNDPLSPVAGQDADAGEIGDVVVALIAFGDDFMIFGCAGSIHLLKGDPASGGSIDELDHTTGIWGPKAWCRDSSNNIFFYGAHGLYKISAGMQGLENLSQSVIPTLAETWAADTSTHRIVLAYDGEREGILVTRTTLATGANLSYFYSLTLQSFYPESFPSDCGVYSVVSYDSSDPTYRKLLLGSTDGYIRTYDNSYKYDEKDATIAAISTYAGWVTKLTMDDDEDAVLNHITVETAGGITGGSLADSDTTDLYFFVGDDADTVVENMAYNTLAFYSCSFLGTGLQPKERVRIRARYLGTKVYGCVTGVSWAINRLSGDVEQMGDVQI
jgi:hypothetical protein